MQQNTKTSYYKTLESERSEKQVLEESAIVLFSDESAIVLFWEPLEACQKALTKRYDKRYTAPKIQYSPTVCRYYNY